MDYSPPGSLSMGFPRQEYWSGLPFLPPGNLPDPVTELPSPASLALEGRFFTKPPGKIPSLPTYKCIHTYISYISVIVWAFITGHPSHLKYYKFHFLVKAMLYIYMTVTEKIQWRTKYKGGENAQARDLETVLPRPNYPLKSVNSFLINPSCLWCPGHHYQ